ncbi:MAG TPA: hypothetical protein VG847_01030 [Chitinophagaceae bacterium]|nr:hypothetical protein [Chitinophagaceae bacterium]
MQDVLTSYLIQKKECSLPYIGSFKIIRISPEPDITGKLFSAPADEIIYSASSHYNSGDLTQYVAVAENVNTDEAEERINNWCLNQKMNLENNEEVLFEPLGSLRKDDSGNIVFEKKNRTMFYDAVVAVRVVHKDVDHPVLVGDTETTSSIMNEFLKKEAPAEKSWRMPALILAVIAVLLFVYFFHERPVSATGVSNNASIEVKAPAPAYQEVK